MSNQVIVHKGRTNVLQVNMGIDVSADTITSQIRTEPHQDAPLIAAWTVSKPNGGNDGMLRLTMDNSITSQIEVSTGYMDLKRLVAGEPIPVFEKPLEVSFVGSVTA